MQELKRKLDNLPLEFFSEIARINEPKAETVGLLAMKYLGEIAGIQEIFEIEPDFIGEQSE